MRRALSMAVLLTAVVTALVLPPAASAAIRENLTVPYGSATDFDGERQRLALDLYRPVGHRERAAPP